MASSWKTLRLGDLVEFTPKRTIKKGTIAPFVSMADIPENSKFIPSIFEKEFKGGGSRFANGDTVFARITPCLQNGKTAKVSGLANGEVAHGSTEFIVFASKESDFDQEFIYYLSRSPEFRAYAEARMEGTTGRQRVAWQALAEYEVTVPNKEIRQSIGTFLAKFDEKIDLNQQTNQTLEQMAQALFKSWFVDFDPVVDNALAAGNPVPDELAHRVEFRKKAHALPDFQPLPEHIRNLFPNEFEQTGEPNLGIGGWVPKGWICKPVSQALIVNPKIKLSKGEVARFADMKAIPTNGFHVEDIIEKEFNGGAKFQQHDVLLARITPCLENGKTALVDFLKKDEVGFGSTEFIVLRGCGAISYPYVACLSRLDSFRQHCILNMVGSSGRQRVQNSCFDSFFLSLPKDERLLTSFDRVCKPMFEKMTVSGTEIKSLAKMRDTLLPRLISGELKLNKDVA